VPGQRICGAWLARVARVAPWRLGPLTADLNGNGARGMGSSGRPAAFAQSHAFLPGLFEIVYRYAYMSGLCHVSSSTIYTLYIYTRMHVFGVRRICRVLAS